ncbi:MAG TPA: choice-of-anchor U domain-containing protein [Bacillota bacterium]|nr:choice-of-anchor U domain-containing protein [Bacillota bacterium]
MGRQWITKKRVQLTALIVAVALFSAAGVLPYSRGQVHSAANGKIAYTLFDGSTAQIYTINADGSNKQQLTNGADDIALPDWSPDGTKLVTISAAFGSPALHIINADGTNAVDITDGSHYDFSPRWSPDGTKIVYASDGEIAVINADGTNRQVLTSSAGESTNPSWKPDGSLIVYEGYDGSHTQIMSIRPDGTNQTQLTSDAHEHATPVWSPDGTKIALVYAPSLYDNHLTLMNPDGTNLQMITTADNDVINPSWSPDGTKLLYTNVDSGLSIQRIYTINLDGTGETAVTPNDGFQSVYASWQPLSVGDTDSDGVANAIEIAAPNGGDANGDGIGDQIQPNVTSLVNPVSGAYTVVQSSCSTSSGVSAAAAPASFKDAAFAYPQGLLSFTLNCGANGATATVTQYYFGLAAKSSLVLRKYNAVSHVYQTVSGAVITTATVGGQSAAKVTYQITDGSSLDQDGAANGVIVDPVGIAAPSVGVPNTGLGGTAR